MSVSANNGQPDKTLRDSWRSMQAHKAMQQYVRSLLGVMLLVLLMLAVGCASKPQMPCEPLPVTQPYVLTQPLPSVSYLQQSQLSDENSLKKLTGTLSTSKP